MGRNKYAANNKGGPHKASNPKITNSKTSMLVPDDMSLPELCSDSRLLKAKQFVRCTPARSATLSNYPSAYRV